MSDKEKQINRTILYGYICDMECFHDTLTALNSFDFSTLHVKKKSEIRDAIKDIQKQINELLTKLD